ncbi:MAG: PD40 domain-containing protein, partial [Oricola sp.]|nr:PD40 domain-containing protein [Oricola sp.]
MRDFLGVAISPDGVSVAFCEERASIERNTYDSVWHVGPLDGSAAPVRIADGGVPLRNGGQALNEAPQWSPDSRWIYYRALIDGEVQIWRAARDGTRTERVTEDAADIEAYHLSSDGKRLTYRVGASREAIAR